MYRKSVLGIAVSLLALAFVAPVTNAEPACVEAYPYSKLCEGDVVGFVNAVAPVECDGCPTIEPAQGGPDCIQVIPWSHLCNGDVDKFVGYFADRIDPEMCLSIGVCFTPELCMLDNDCFDIPVDCLHVSECPRPTGTDCVMVYPWSKLCQGDVGGFLAAVLGPALPA